MSASASSNSIQVGLAERIITPPLGVEMAGFAARQGVAQGVHDELHARALVIAGPDAAVALLSASLIGLDQEIVDQVRHEVSQHTGLDKANILLAATHTHSGPTVAGDYRAFLVEQCVECLEAAWKEREPGRVGIGSGHVEDVGRNRRRLAYGGLPVDPEVGIVKIEDAAGRLKGVLFNYACHPTTLGPDNLLITEDWAGYAIGAIREQAGDETVVLFVNGTEGDINPGYDSGLSAIGAPIPIRTFPFAEKIGTRLGRTALDTLGGIETRAAFPIRSLSRRIDLPFRQTFPVTVEEAEALQQKAREEFARVERDPGAPTVLRHQAEIAVFFAGMVCDQARAFHAPDWPPAVSVELQSIRLDHAVLTSFPGEVFVEIGLELKQHSPFSPTLVIGLANGRSGGYLPTRATYSEGDYEVVASKYSESAGEVLIEETLEQLALLVY